MQEGRVGGHSTTKDRKMINSKISESLKKYYSENKEIQKAFPVTQKYSCKPVNKYTLEGELVETYTSISEAARAHSVAKYAIQQAIRSDFSRTSCGFKWKYASEST